MHGWCSVCWKLCSFVKSGRCAWVCPNQCPPCWQSLPRRHPLLFPQNPSVPATWISCARTGSSACSTPWCATASSSAETDQMKTPTMLDAVSVISCISGHLARGGLEREGKQTHGEGTRMLPGHLTVALDSAFLGYFAFRSPDGL